ncbi:MAG: hypothetical protein ABIP45_09000, partial [Knoellia sp.]
MSRASTSHSRRDGADAGAGARAEVRVMKTVAEAAARAAAVPVDVVGRVAVAASGTDVLDATRPGPTPASRRL